jgi:hypothetical protein
MAVAQGPLRSSACTGGPGPRRSGRVTRRSRRRPGQRCRIRALLRSDLRIGRNGDCRGTWRLRAPACRAGGGLPRSQVIDAAGHLGFARRFFARRPARGQHRVPRAGTTAGGVARAERGAPPSPPRSPCPSAFPPRPHGAKSLIRRCSSGSVGIFRRVRRIGREAREARQRLGTQLRGEAGGGGPAAREERGSGTLVFHGFSGSCGILSK